MGTLLVSATVSSPITEMAVVLKVAMAVIGGATGVVVLGRDVVVPVVIVGRSVRAPVVAPVTRVG